VNPTTVTKRILVAQFPQSHVSLSQTQCQVSIC
jgi:hypothetical protein